jgi:hypothetical protein
MPKKRMMQGSGGSIHCWVCGKQLQRAPGKGLGLIYFRLVFADEHERRVHDDCFESAIRDGAKKLS